MAIKKTHTFVITINMNRKCSQRHALREIRDTIYGLHYCTVFNDGTDPETFRIRSIKPTAATAKRRSP
jgi:hypothetical protein